MNKTTAVIIIVLLLGILAFGQRRPSTAPPAEGRFALFSASQSTSTPGVYLVDTQTGRVWSCERMTNMSWELDPIPFSRAIHPEAYRPQ